MHRLIYLCLLFAPAAALAASPCESLRALRLPHLSITSATSVSAGRYLDYRLPARCVVQAVSRPAQGSEIRIEIWLPEASRWSGRYQQVGNGGWAGIIPYTSLAYALSRFDATAATDDGHQGGESAAWAIGQPERVTDFAWRAVRETSLAAKAVVAAFYGRPAKFNYFTGCSDGGREALIEAQRFPGDFDGILAGAPALDWTRLFAGFVWNELALLESQASGIPTAKLATLQKAVLESCDHLDGLRDGIITDPRRCRFEPSTLLCRGADSNACFTEPQLTALRRVILGPRTHRGARIHPGYLPSGVETTATSWKDWIVDDPPANAAQFFFGNSLYGQVVHQNPKWDFRSFDLTRDPALAESRVGFLNASSADLRSFHQRGGKLILYHGWGDATVTPLGSIEYFDKLKRAFGPALSDFLRLYMVPGMGHCSGGLGAIYFGNGGPAPRGEASHDILTALEEWVELGRAPQSITASGTSPRPLTRPLCPHPQTAQYKGSGDPDKASSFRCAGPN